MIDALLAIVWTFGLVFTAFNWIFLVAALTNIGQTEIRWVISAIIVHGLCFAISSILALVFIELPVLKLVWATAFVALVTYPTWEIIHNRIVEPPEETTEYWVRPVK